LAGDLAVAAAKFGASALSGSTAMLTEAIHSLVEMRINGGLGRTSRFCETPPRTFPAGFAISQSVHQAEPNGHQAASELLLSRQDVPFVHSERQRPEVANMTFYAGTRRIDVDKMQKACRGVDSNHWASVSIP
jgi:hypothetical protein